MNHVVLIGNVGRDPEIRYTQSGDPIAGFSLATSERWTAKDGEKQERTEWHRISVFGKPAQVVRDYVSKGDRIAIVGKIHYSEWEDNDGNKRKGVEIQVSFGGQVELLGGKKKDGGGEASAPAEGEKPWQATDDDVPF